jgi:hypothetical protein
MPPCVGLELPDGAALAFAPVPAPAPAPAEGKQKSRPPAPAGQDRASTFAWFVELRGRLMREQSAYYKQDVREPLLALMRALKLSASDGSHFFFGKMSSARDLQSDTRRSAMYAIGNLIFRLLMVLFPKMDPMDVLDEGMGHSDWKDWVQKASPRPKAVGATTLRVLRAINDRRTSISTKRALLTLIVGTMSLDDINSHLDDYVVHERLYCESRRLLATDNVGRTPMPPLKRVARLFMTDEDLLYALQLIHSPEHVRVMASGYNSVTLHSGKCIQVPRTTRTQPGTDIVVNCQAIAREEGRCLPSDRTMFRLIEWTTFAALQQKRGLDTAETLLGPCNFDSLRDVVRCLRGTSNREKEMLIKGLDGLEFYYRVELRLQCESHHACPSLCM